MTPALRWAAMRAILMFHNCEGQSHKTVSTDHNFSRERRAEADSNRGPSAYQPTASTLGQTGSTNWAMKVSLFLSSQWWQFLLPLSAGQMHRNETMADDPVTSDKLASQSAVSFGHFRPRLRHVTSTKKGLGEVVENTSPRIITVY